jgi:hypothetical protein
MIRGWVDAGNLTYGELAIALDTSEAEEIAPPSGVVRC